MLPDPSQISALSAEDFNASTDPWTLIDVRTKEPFARESIPSAENLCVYEVAFTENIKTRCPDMDQPVCVYGESDDFHAADAAIRRLLDSGYTRVAKIKDGLRGWKAAGLETRTYGESRMEADPAGTYRIDRDSSRIAWTGRNPTNRHFGQVGIESGHLIMDAEGVPREGELTVDMHRLTCDDLKDKTMAQALLAHLSNQDFFEVDQYPKSHYKLTSARRLPEAPHGQPNFEIEGELTIKERTFPKSVSALILPVPEGQTFQTQFTFNRVDFGALYGSGSIFENLGRHLVNDLVSIEVIARFVEGKD